VKEPKATIFNWELGVLFPPMKNSKKMKQEILETLTIDYCNMIPYSKEDKPYTVSAD